MGASRKYTTQERKQLQELLEKGYSHRKCGAIIGRAKSSISSEFAKGKVEGKYSWEFSERNSVPRFNSELKQKVAMIELQLEILTDQVRILNERNIKN